MQARQGVIYAYVTLQMPWVYYFGRTKNACVRALDCSVYARTEADQSQLNGEMHKLLQNYCNRNGLNASDEVVLWRLSEDVVGDWGRFQELLRRKPWVEREWMLGRQWFSIVPLNEQPDRHTYDRKVRRLYEFTTGNSNPLEPLQLLNQNPPEVVDVEDFEPQPPVDLDVDELEPQPPVSLQI